MGLAAARAVVSSRPLARQAGGHDGGGGREASVMPTHAEMKSASDSVVHWPEVASVTPIVRTTAPTSAAPVPVGVPWIPFFF